MSMSDDTANERRRFLRSGTAGLVGAMVAVRSEAQTLTPPTALDGRVNPNGRFTGKVVLITGGTNAGGVFRCMRAEIPIMLQQGGGVIINNASVSAHTAFHGMSGYAASKHAVLGLTKVAAAELGDKNIRVVSISPLRWTRPCCGAACSTSRCRPSRPRPLIPSDGSTRRTRSRERSCSSPPTMRRAWGAWTSTSRADG
jgi:hypothetical protein